MDNIKELQEKFETGLKALREEVEQKTVDNEKVKKINESLDNLDKKFAEIKTADDARKNKEEEFEEKMNLIESKLVSSSTSELKSQEVIQEKKSFESLLRKKADQLSADELKYLRTDNNENGGYLVPVDFRNELIKKLTEVSPVRSLARVINTSRSEIHIPKRETLVSGGWIAEGATASESNSTYGLEKLPVHKMMVYSDVTHEMIRDSAFNIEAEINSDISESFAKLEGTAFISGNSVGKPEGILTNASVGSTNTGNATEITADSLFELQGDFKNGYLNQNNLTWMLNQDTLYKHIRTLKDGNGQYLLVSGIRDGLVPTIAGRPYVIAPDMPDVGAGLYPMVLGDFRTAYYIADNMMTEMIRDDFSQSTSGKVRFVFYKRVGGQVVKPEAIRKLKVSA